MDPFSAILHSSNSLTPPPTMANFTPYSSSSSSSENSVVSAASSSSGAPEDACEDACSICLEPFTTADPSSVTSCKHEYHLHCILEWSQRSKECPICCQSLVLWDSSSQELLAAVGIDRHSRSRSIYSAAPTSLHHFCRDFDVGHDTPNSDVSDFDERIIQHQTGAASRAQYVCRSERQKSGIGPSQVLAFTSPANTSQKPYAGSPKDCPNLSYGSIGGRSASLDIPSTDNFEPPASVDVNLISSTPLNRDISFDPRILYSQPPLDSPRSSATEMFSFPETLKSKLSAASSRYKESISKSTQGFKEKLLAHNNSVKELGKGIQHEMNAGIVGLARMIERLDLNSKKSGSSVPVFNCTGGTSNLSFKGKGVEENVGARSLDKLFGQIARDLSPNATYNSGAILGQSGNPHPKVLKFYLEM